jgi:hypothetical protein
MDGARSESSSETPAEQARETLSGSGRCDSCGRDEDDLVAVHRVYVTPESWDAEGKVEVVAEVERWCFVCRTHYPHQEVGRDEG